MAGLILPFVGIGPGRCGTTSLSRIVGSCQGAHVTHEESPVCWYDLNQPNVDEFAASILVDAERGIIRGEVASYLGPHIEQLRRTIPGMPVVCMHRDKRDTLISMFNHGGFALRPIDKQLWAEKNANIKGTKRWLVPSRLPIIDAFSNVQATAFYYDMYEEIMRTMAEPVIHLDVEDLNNDLKLRALFDFLEIPSGQMRYPEQRVWHPGKDIEQRREQKKIVEAR